MKEQKGYWFNVGWSRWKTHQIICWIKSENLDLHNRSRRIGIKKAKRTKRCVIKRQPKFEDYKNCLEATQTENRIRHLQKNKTDVNSLKKDCKEFVKKTII